MMRSGFDRNDDRQRWRRFLNNLTANFMLAYFLCWTIKNNHDSRRVFFSCDIHVRYYYCLFFIYEIKQDLGEVIFFSLRKCQRGIYEIIMSERFIY